MGIIEELRRKKELNIQSAAKLAGVSVGIWVRAEKGKNLTLLTLRKIAKALDVSIHKLIEE